jgi:hypothetical protein
VNPKSVFEAKLLCGVDFNLGSGYILTDEVGQTLHEFGKERINPFFWD